MAVWDTVPHVLFSFHGALPGGEIWSCGLRTTRADADIDLTVFQNLTLGAANLFGAMISGLGLNWAAPVTFAGVTARSLNERGVTVRLAESAPAAAAVGTGTLALPNQCAMAITLLTARAGRTGKGRIYLPTLSSNAVGADGRIGAGLPLTFANAVETLINGLNTGLEVLVETPLIGVQSGSESANTEGGYDGAAVTAVSVGNVFDTQRRRRSSIIETYTTVPVAP